MGEKVEKIIELIEKHKEAEDKKDEKKKEIQTSFPKPSPPPPPETPKEIKERVIKERDESPLRHKPPEQMTGAEKFEWEILEEAVKKATEVVEVHEELEEELEEVEEEIRKEFPKPEKKHPPETPEEIKERFEEVRDESPLRHKPVVLMTPAEKIEWEIILEQVKNATVVFEEYKEKEDKYLRKKEELEKLKNETIIVVKNMTERFPPPPDAPPRDPDLPPETPEEIKERVIKVRDDSPLRHKPEEEMLEPEKIEWEEIKED